ncbi:uncharacterized protein B0P05DRAFT_541600 [Gilbertella persicaria]|uniref:uncharacterized protein n=1 Tax=Gilbertella persicaria TaxID=101096 RepID=UPI00221E86B0|nr:uncharacterized protein B0P05DRAFT_541600 [Gilbertella persicaria]KAI8079690.1 hypothetical protein B0P05DRAFT_541600 [Gilbertella persicaria]
MNASVKVQLYKPIFHVAISFLLLMTPLNTITFKSFKCIKQMIHYSYQLISSCLLGKDISFSEEQCASLFVIIIKKKRHLL